MTEDQHYPRPSTAHRWVGAGCTGSIRLSQGEPDTAGPWAEEGTRLHELAASVLSDGGARLEDLPAEDYAVLEPYVRDVRGVSANALALLVEEPLVGTFGGYQLQGTPDAVACYDRTAIVWDLKTGWGIVEAKRNWQLLCYAWMVAGPRPECTSVEVRIVQPRPYHPDGVVRSWRITRPQLVSFHFRIAEALREIYEGRERLRTSASCRYCPALAHCPAMRELTLDDLDYAGTPDRVDLPDDAIAAELKVLRAGADRLKLRVAALEETILSRLREGRSVTGASIRESAGRLVWRYDDEDVLVFLGDKHKRVSAPTPTQALNAGVPETFVRQLAKRKPGKITIDTDGADRARRIFEEK